MKLNDEEAAMRAGEFDWWENPTIDLLGTLQREPGLTSVVKDHSGSIGIMRFNCLYPPFDKPAIRRIADGACRACGAQMEFRYERRYPPLINALAETEVAAATAAAIVGESNVKRDLLPSMAAEDFAYFLEQKPGAYIWIGNGTAQAGGILHNPRYDFNDEVFAARCELLGAARRVGAGEGARSSVIDVVSRAGCCAG